VSDFDALHSRNHDKRAQLYAFDIFAGDAEDLRSLPLSLRKASLVGVLTIMMISDTIRSIGRPIWRTLVPRSIQLAYVLARYSSHAAPWRVLRGSVR
jgi:ATP-dependent DNA ligase